MTEARQDMGAELDGLLVRQAFDWHVRLQSGASGTSGARTRRAFEDWLQAHPDHGRAWQRAQSVTQAMRRDFDTLSRDTPQASREALDSAARRLSRRRALAKLSVGGAVVLPAAWLAHGQLPWQRALADVATATGEQRRVTLDDGTALALNTDTALQLRFDATQRRIVLTRGEIALASGPDAGAARHRPLQVQTPHGLLEALGTRFIVRLLGDGIQVAVEEGVVALRPAQPVARLLQASGRGSRQGFPAPPDGAALPPASGFARAGQVMQMTRQDLAPADTLGLDPGGWVDGALVCRGMRLDHFLAEVSRYRHGRIACDASVAGLRLSGVYRLEDTARLLAMLPDLLPVRLDFLTRYWARISARR